MLGRCQSGRLGLPAKQLGGVELPPGFESLPPRCVMDDQAPVAQWIERLVADQKVSGSSPDRGTREGQQLAFFDCKGEFTMNQPPWLNWTERLVADQKVSGSSPDGGIT